MLAPLLAAGLLAFLPNQGAAPDPAPGIERLARPLIDADEVPGLVLAWVTTDGTSGTLALGKRGRDDAKPMPSDALFEIGSLTKAFTGLCLTRAAARGELALEDPLAPLLPEALRTRAAAEVELIHLATHTAGLPEIPTNLVRDVSRFTVDYSGYGEADLEAFLRGLTLLTPPGKTWLYSNAGYGLLGQALAWRAGTSYEALVRREVIEPLRLASTAITLTPALERRLVPGHDPNGDPVPPTTFGALEGCGGLRSDAADLLRFACALRDAPEREGEDEGELGRALALATTVAFRQPNGVGVAPGWNLALDGATYLHDGQTAGFSGFVSFDRVHGTVVVVLANGSSPRVLELGVLVLRHLLGLAVEPPALEVPARLDGDQLEPLTGSYAAPGLALEVTRVGDHLYARIQGQPAYRLFPRGPLHFTYRNVPATVEFQGLGEGAPSALILRQNGREYRCPRQE